MAKIPESKSDARERLQRERNARSREDPGQDDDCGDLLVTSKVFMETGRETGGVLFSDMRKLVLLR